jgi:hypothetical protein
MISLRLALVFLVAFVPASVLACSCVVDAEESYKAAQQVRIVRILTVQGASEHPTLGYASSATFEIAETLKGIDTEPPGVLYAQGMCSDGFEPGALYLVALKEGEAVVSVCSGSYSFPAATLDSDPRVARARRVLQSTK